MPSLLFRRRPGHLLGAGLLLTGALAFRPLADDGAFPRIVRSLVAFYGTSLPEKAYLHLNQPVYASGETIWFKAYVVEADSHQADTLSKVLYVELLRGPRLVAQRTLRLQGGLTHGELALPDTLPAGTYQLRAYTSWMRNAGTPFFFARPLTVVQAGSAPAAPAVAPLAEVQFFPEGGNLVSGLASVVGFKAVDKTGHGVAVQGRVLDGQGQEVVSFTSRHLGMGSFSLTPAPGQAYRAVVTGPDGRRDEYPLPASQPAGYALHVSETADDFVVEMRWRAGAGAAGPALLLAQVRGKVAYASRVSISGAAPLVARLPKAKFPPGLAHITLFDEQGTAQCERLVFVPNPPGVRLALVPDKPTYNPREAVRLRLAATDAAGQPVAGQFSVAVTAGPGGADDGPTIVSHLLLSSDLAGMIEDPGYYFREPQTADTRQALDDLLLTQGWRRFVWKELLAGQLPERTYPLEQGLGLSGQLFTATGAPAAGHAVAALQTMPQREAQLTTDAAGRFRFAGFDGLDTAYVMLRAQPTRGERELRISLLPSPAAGPLPLAPPPPATLADYARRGQQQLALERRLPGPGTTTALGDVRVRGQRERNPPDRNTRPYSVANGTVLQIPDPAISGDSRTVIQYLQGRVAGVTVSGNTINIRQASSLQNQSGGSILREPLYLIDGAIVPSETFGSFPLREVQTIDVLNQSSAALFGSQGAGGVIALHTRQAPGLGGAGASPGAALGRAGALSVQVPGYYRAREFYAPRYGGVAPASGPDPRYTSLYWAPDVRTPASGQAELTFFTSDASGEFQAVAEGLGAPGTPLHGSAKFTVQGRPAR